MIPGTFTEPLPRVVHRRRRPGFALAVLGAVLLGVGIVGGVVWYRYSPFSYVRVQPNAEGRSTDLSAGSYVVYEERPDASEPDLPPPVLLTVTTRSGTNVPTTSLIERGSRGNPMSYRTPWQEGRAIARFVVDDDGAHLLGAVAVSARARQGGYSSTVPGTLAIARESDLDVLGRPWAVLPLCVVPVALGTVLLVVGTLRGRRARRAAATAREP